MSPAVLVATILALGWNLTLAVAAALTETGPFRSDPVPSTRRMRWSDRTVRADVGAPDFDARMAAQNGQMEDEATESLRSRAAGASREMDVDVRYASACVTVMTDSGPQTRRCAVCMN
ncbi:MAG: hypothetical protein ABEL97_04875 [Salinibacter sp.]